MSTLGLHHRFPRAIFFAALCWIVPLLLAVVSADAAAFANDWGVWAKFLVAPILFTLTEHPIGFAVDECVSVLFRTPLIAARSKDDAYQARIDAKADTVATLPEAICLLLAIAASVFNYERFHSGFAPEWAVSQGTFTLAGTWCVVVSNTVYWFLLARLVWKHIVWSRFLSRIARCRLRLAVTHPDGHGGLGLLGRYPAGYALFTLAVSSVAAAGIGHVMQRETVTPTLFTAVCAGWLLVALLYYALPLVALGIDIARLKRRAAMLSIVKATDFERSMERSLLGENIEADEVEMETPEFRDLKPLYLASLKTSALLINKGNVLPILVPALLPLLVVGASYLSYAQLGPIVKRLLFL
ncbi:hypothetical protein J5287_24095 [Rhizobium sp. K1/93]|nr:hypothetical protein [Rhizobium sp. L58/93]MBO9170726.1 hypothetical protein [Rhizobium sp. L245/93]MBO9186549.1 hypothetical protein [Rhizobium sp. E27B/91]QXZ87461.1 hypothetical protein J5287_24095 [Rhizobium sp. K1/93]QXZ93520.1 hypothetical protein J5280_25095 [Rhizobium sp. K15/93]QYA04835.1 hypothetical protein J5278_19635 [Rhizobium sp. B21/90]